MMRRTALFPTCAATLVVGVVASGLSAGSWPQFRGPSSGRAESTTKLPAEINPENFLWKVAVPPGHSSPAIAGDRIFLTAVRDGRLLTMGLDRKTGKTLWEQPAPHETLEEIHRIGSYAQCSPATDGERVVAFFGSSGLFCYDADGKLLWSHRMGPFKNDFGAGSSPFIADDRVILCQDHDVGSFLAAWDKKTGKLLWRTERSDFFRNYCSPVLWESGGKRQIVLAGTLRVMGYDFDTGKELWALPGISRVVCMTPSVGEDGTLYVAGWSAGGGDEGSRVVFPPFEEAIAAHDKNANGTFEEDELPKGDFKQRYTQVDRDKDGHVTRDEYDSFRRLFDKSQNMVMALRPSESSAEPTIAWKYEKNVPFCSSPVYYDGKLFLVKDGGILTCLDAKTGKPQKVARLPNTGEYYSSPVAGDGKVYFLNEDGQLTVISAEGKWDVLHTTDFKEPGYATPAIVDGTIFLRTGSHLYCFGP